MHRPHVERHCGRKKEERPRRVVAAHGPGTDLLKLAVVRLDVPPLAVQLVDIESRDVEVLVGEVCRVQDVHHLLLLSLFVLLDLFDNDQRELERLASRAYGAARDCPALARDVLVKRPLDGRRANRAHDKVQPAGRERLHDADGEEPAVEQGERGPDAPPGAVVE